MPDDATQPATTPMATPPIVPKSTDEQLQPLLQKLIGRMGQPKMAGPQPQAEQTRSMTPQGYDPTHSLVRDLFGLVANASAKTKQQQLDHATARIKSIGDAISDAYEMAQGDEAKAKQIFMESPAVKALQSKEGLKDLKQMEKLLQYDFLNPEKKKTVWHEALGRVAKIGGAERIVKGMRHLMGQHKDRMAEQQKTANQEFQQRQEAGKLSETMFQGARPQQPQMTVAQEIKAMMDTAKNEREALKNEREGLRKEQELKLKQEEFADKKEELNRQFKEKQREFDEKEAALKRREEAADKYRGEMLKMRRDALEKSGASSDLKRLVIGLNYAPQLLKPGEAAQFGMQVDDDGNLVPAKSPLAATTEEKNAAQQAKVMDSLIDTTLNVLDSPDIQNKLGPYHGRMSEIIQGKIGANVPEFDTLRTLGSFDASGMLKLHFGKRGGQQIYDKIHSMIDTGKLDEASLREALNTFKKVSSIYRKELYSVRDKNKPQGATSNSGEVVIDLTKKPTP